MADAPLVAGGDRLAKVIARSGLCSRRDAETWIKEGRVAVNGKTVKTPAFNVTERDVIKVDGEVLAARQGTRVWLYHKPAGLVVTEKDPEGRETIFEKLEAQGLPRVVTIGRLDINTEGLLLLTNDGGLKRVLELPATGWLRKYRVRAFGSVTQAQLDHLKQGVEIEGVKYGPIDATLERPQGSNVWLLVALREGKNREIKNVLASLGLQVNRLIRVSYGPFQLGDLPIGAVETVKARVLRDQLGKRLAEEAGVDFESELPEAEDVGKRRAANPKLRAAAPGKEAPKQGRAGANATLNRFRFTDRAEKTPRELQDEDRPRKDRPGRFDNKPSRPRRPEAAADEGPARKILFDDGREPAEFKEKSYGKKTRDEKPGGKPADRPAAPRREGGERPARSFSDKPKRDFGDRPRPPRADGERPRNARRDHGATDARPKRDFADRPKRDFGDKPRAPRSAADGARPARSFGDKPRTPRAFGEKPKRDFGDKPRPPRTGGDKPARPARSYGDKPRTAAPAGAEQRLARKPQAKRDGAAPARTYRPGGGSARPAGSKPRPPRRDGPPTGGPRAPRKPRA
jgi:23S rRNA pseudouridine2605 synthase